MNITKELGVKKLRTTSYDPESKTFEFNEETIPHGSPRNRFCSKTRMGLLVEGSSVHSSTGFTPAELMFRVPRTFYMENFAKIKVTRPLHRIRRKASTHVQNFLTKNASKAGHLHNFLR